MNKEVKTEQNQSKTDTPLKQLSDLLMPKGAFYSGYFLKGIDKVVSPDEMRPALGHAWFKNGFLYATNSHIAVKINLDFLSIEEDDQHLFEGKSFNREALKELSKITKDTMWYISDFGITIHNTKVILFSNEEHNFPDIDAVIPKEQTPIDSISVKSEYVKVVEAIYKNLGGEKQALIMEFYGTNKAVKLIGNYSEKFEAIIMPVTF